MKIIFLLLLLEIAAVSGFKCGISPLATKKYAPIIGNDRYFLDENVPRVLGGEESLEHRWPWIVSFGFNEKYILERELDKKLNLSSKHFIHDCTATIIHEKWILLAEHCVMYAKKKIPYLTVGVGSIEFGKQIFHKIKDIYEFPHFNFHDLSFDIALIELEKPLVFDENVSPICLAKNDGIKFGEFVVTVGWGLVFNYVKAEFTYTRWVQPNHFLLENSDSEILKENILMISKYSECFHILKSQGTMNPSDYLLCHHGINNGVSNGDSGGPMMAFRNGKWIQVGVASNAIMKIRLNNRLDVGTTAVYSRVNYFCDWIANTTENEVFCH
uniref:Peptidase S1 domain-containing protein n=1 Tax=Panagrolaimus sp. JU765 TaxID=591449 RepID=A0AC34RFJ3_9BILA